MLYKYFFFIVSDNVQKNPDNEELQVKKELSVKEELSIKEELTIKEETPMEDGNKNIE